MDQGEKTNGKLEMLAMSRDLPGRKCTEASCNGLCWNVEMLVVLCDTRPIESKVWTERDFEVVFPSHPGR